MTADDRIFSDSECFVGNMMFRKILWFCTSIGKAIKVRFNSLGYQGDQPMTHVNPPLYLPVSYTSYDDIVQEVELTLSDPKFSWEMDAS